MVSLKFRSDVFDWSSDASDARKRALKDSERSDAHVQGGSCKEQQGNDDETAEGGNDLEHLCASQGAGRAGKTLGNRDQARA
jgi:hypothetical protein